MRLGARMMKTGIAVVLSLYICDWFDLQPVLLVVIAAVITTQPSVYRSFKFFWEQVQANAIGAVLGIAGVKLLGNDPIIIGLIVIIVIIVSLLLKLEAGISLAIVTVIAVMGEPDSALNRVFLIMLGVILAMIVNALLWPPNHEKNLWNQLKKLNERVLLLLRNIADGVFDEASFRTEQKELRNELKKTNDLFILAREERQIMRKEALFTKKAKIVIFKRMLDVLQQEMHLIDIYRKRDLLPIAAEIKEHMAILARYHETIALRYEGKMKMMNPVQRKQAVLAHNEQLLKRFFTKDGFIHDQNDLSRNQIFLVVAALTELTQTLGHLDTLATSYLKNHDGAAGKR